MKKRRKVSKPKRVARKRPVRARKAARARKPRPTWKQKQDADDIRRAIDDGMQDLRMKQ